MLRARSRTARTEGEQLDGTDSARAAPPPHPGEGEPPGSGPASAHAKPERQAPGPPQLTENFSSLIAAKSLTSPPTRLVA